MTAIQDNTQTLPAKAGVYIIQAADIPECTLYVGITNNLRTRLSPSHEALTYCRNRGIKYTIDWELEPNEKKRKRREHQLISEFDAKLNDGGIPSDSGKTGSEWRDDIYALACQIREEEAGLDLKPVTKEYTDSTREQIDTCHDWLEHVWINPYEGKASLDYGMDPGDFSSWVIKWIPKSVEFLKSFLPRFSSSEIPDCTPLNFKDSRDLYNQNGSTSKFWFYRDLKITSGSRFILKYLAEIVYGEPLDINSEGLEKSFRNLLECLNPTIAAQWEPFKREFRNMHGIADERLWMRNLVQDFSNHALIWSVVNYIDLFSTVISDRALFSKFFLESLLEQKYFIEKTFDCYVSLSAFILALVEYFENAYGLEYRIKADYDSRYDYICDQVDLRLNPHQA